MKRLTEQRGGHENCHVLFLFRHAVQCHSSSFRWRFCTRDFDFYHTVYIYASSLVLATSLFYFDASSKLPLCCFLYHPRLVDSSVCAWTCSWRAKSAAMIADYIFRYPHTLAIFPTFILALFQPAFQVAIFFPRFGSVMDACALKRPCKTQFSGAMRNNDVCRRRCIRRSVCW